MDERRGILVGLAIALAVAGLLGLVLPMLKAAAPPSVVRDITLVNGSEEPCTVVVIRCPADGAGEEEIVIRVTLGPGSERTLRLFEGDDPATYRRTGFLITARARDDEVSAQLLYGAEIDERRGVVSVRKNAGQEP